MKNWIRLVSLFALLPAFVTAHASGKVQPKNNSTTREMSLYIGKTSPTQPTVATENDFINAWNAPARDALRKAAKNTADLDQIYELNREAARIWEDLRECNRSAKDVEGATRIAYLQGTLCASSSPRAPEFPRRIAELQNRIESFAATSWIGGNNPLVPGEKLELPAAHPFFAEMLIERLSLRLHAWSTSMMAIEFNATMPLRSTDKPSDNTVPGSNAIVGEILLLGALPASLGSDRGGFYSCPAYEILSLAFQYFRGADAAGWKESLVALKADLSGACLATKNGDGEKWSYLAIYQWLALRYGATQPKGFTKVDWKWLGFTFSPGGFLIHGVRYKDRTVCGMDIVLFPMALVRSILRCEKPQFPEIANTGD